VGLVSAHWEHYPHPADIGVRGFGPTAAVAFAEVALAMTAATTDPDRVRPETPVEIKGATYTGLRVRDGGGEGWTAERIIDV
jgi:SHS2 domain-containing protein